MTKSKELEKEFKDMAKKVFDLLTSYYLPLS